MDYPAINYVVAFIMILIFMAVAGGFILGVFYLLPRSTRKRILEAVDNGEI